ncbi:hypothetical protein G7Z17_g13479 [Cylindrodendrum hubeiense]|uniref:Uncharacterized protein n=1 Tax=Cylindrodendrum hubeiense TaxID=595255 RepID=A0A9P5GWX5_9HYPO|nr:hypothetical protein G7Z17_g13479 [Cylindrodendrum hubeiense]
MSTLAEPRRPRLLAQNRKLRHLRGVWLRNLSFAPASLRTTDDADINRSPKKLPVLRESGQLHPSRSSESLRNDSLRPESRRPQKVRRTSLSLAHANPVARQKKLENLVEEAVGDVFYSLHVGGCAEPVYVSEARERSAPGRLRTDHFEVMRHDDPPVGEAAETDDLGDSPPNALVFHLEDGIYSLDFPNRISDPKQAPTIASSSYNALMKLANLESSIEDAMETQRRIMDEINDILEQSPADTSGTAGEAVTLAEKYVTAQRRANRLAEKQRDDLRESLRSRRAAIAEGRAFQAKAEEDIANNEENLQASRVLVEQTEQQIRGQRRRICSDLADIFPITPIPNAPPLSFQICNVPLPNSTYDSATARQITEDVLSAGLGFVSLLTRHLQFYLAHPLPYPLDAFGSRSYARDDISQLSDKAHSRREFPLYLPRGGSTVGQWRFEYAWFLLNKDIESLCSSQGLKVVDIRHSLPNLKYLLYVCSAGTEDVPERKKGGVRGLWAGRLKGRLSTMTTQIDGDGSSTTGSRRGSGDSEMMNQHGDALRKALMKSNGDGTPDEVAVESLSDVVVSLPFEEGDAKFTLRTNGLRENVSR